VKSTVRRHTPILNLSQLCYKLITKRPNGTDCFPPYRVSKWWPTNTTARLCFRDLGSYSNIPIAPLVCTERNIDIIVVLDVSESELQYGQELKKSCEWVHAQYGKKNKTVHFPKTMDDVYVFQGESAPTLTPSPTLSHKRNIFNNSNNKILLDDEYPQVRLLQSPTKRGPFVLYVPIPSCHIPMPTNLSFFSKDDHTHLQKVVAHQWDVASQLLLKLVNDSTIKWGTADMKVT